MKENLLEVMMFLRVARNKLEEEANLLPDDASHQLTLLGDAADDISNILVTLEGEYGT